MKIFALIFFVIIFSLVLSEAYAQTIPSQYKLSVNFENEVLPSYEIILPSDTYVLTQSYSWVRDETSRYNLVAYSIDGGEKIPIPRFARGEFSIDISPDSSHEIKFFSVVQYPIMVTGSTEFSFLPSSPTRDNWFDENSQISVTVPKTYEIENNKVRKIISGWSLDGSSYQPIPKDNSGFFVTPPITMSDFHTVDFVSKTQFKLEVISEIGETTGAGWYSDGEQVTISAKSPMDGLILNVLEGWEGYDVSKEGSTYVVEVEGPTTITAVWSKNYTLLIAVILIPIMGIVFFASKKVKQWSRTKKSNQPKISNIQIPKKKYSAKYDKELSDYLQEQTHQKLETLKESNIITQKKYSEIKEQLE